jgi:sodium-dependent dicarboxylate transporter 2/3/5
MGEVASHFKRKILHLSLGILLGLGAYAIAASLEMPARIAAGVFSLVVYYWVTEVVPLYVTAVFGAFLLQILLGVFAPQFGYEKIDYRLFMTPFASPVVVLLFGGFYMARIFSKYHLDSEFSHFFLTRLGKRASVVLIGIILLTAFLSMWMSNTATTAIMVTAMLPVLRKLESHPNCMRAIMLSIPFAANVGGIGTPIGTPPNAIALGLLSEKGIVMPFFQWMLMAVPPMLLMLLLLWGLLHLFFPMDKYLPEIEIGTKLESSTEKRSWVYTTFFVTVALWVTDSLHGIPSAVVATIPFIVFSVSGLGGKEELRAISWDILLLVGGGISLGVAIQKTGLNEALMNSFELAGAPPILLAIVMCVLVATMGTFMSHTASANLVLPIAITLGATSPVFLAVATALAASYGMALPVSTPPNAIAFGSGYIHLRDMARVGALMTVLGIFLSICYLYILSF